MNDVLLELLNNTLARLWSTASVHKPPMDDPRELAWFLVVAGLRPYVRVVASPKSDA